MLSFSHDKDPMFKENIQLLNFVTHVSYEINLSFFFKSCKIIVI